MALVGTDRGTGGNNTSATTLAIVPASTLPVDTLGVLCIACDNSGSGGGVAVCPATLTDSVGNTWTRRVSGIQDPGAANAGIEIGIYTGAIVTQLTNANNITITWDGGVSVPAKAWTLQSFAGTAPITYVTGAAGAGAATANPTITTGSITNGNAVIGVGAAEQSNTAWGADADTTNGSWSTMQRTGFGTTTSGATVISQYKIVNATGTQTYNPTIVASDRILGWIEVKETAPQVLTLTADVRSYALTGNDTSLGINSKPWFKMGTSVGNVDVARVEISDLAYAPKSANADYLWAIEDGANAYFLAINKTTGALAGQWTLTGATVSDVESMSSATVSGTDYLYLGDTGNNSNTVNSRWTTAGGAKDTSATSTTIGTGSKVFTTVSSFAFATGQIVRVYSTANSANFMQGSVTSVSGNQLTVNVTTVGGSGTFTDWEVHLGIDLRILRCTEPTVTGSDGSIGTYDTIYCAFPGGNIPALRDLEGIFADPTTGDLYMVTKRSSPVDIYRLSHSASYTGTQVLTHVGQVTNDATFNTISTVVSGNNGYVVGAAMSPDGTEILLKSYDSIYYWKKQPGETIAGCLGRKYNAILSDAYVGGGRTRIRALHSEQEPQGEAVTFDRAGSDLYTISEFVSTEADPSGTRRARPLFKYERLSRSPISIAFQHGVDGYSGGTDTYISSTSGTLDTNFVSATSLIFDIDFSAFPTISAQRQGLIKWDTTAVPTGKTVTSAYVEFYINTEGKQFVAHKMLQSWDAATITWNSVTGGISTNDVEASSAAVATLGTTNASGALDTYVGFVRMNLPLSLAQDWVDNPSTNYGLMLTGGPAESTGDGLQVDSNEGTTLTRRPKLVIAYSEPPAATLAANSASFTLTGVAATLTGPTHNVLFTTSGAVTTTTATVLLGASASGTYSLKVYDPIDTLVTTVGPTATTTEGTNHLVKFNITGLTANTTYRYVPNNGTSDHLSAQGFFKTFPAAGTGFTFVHYSCNSLTNNARFTDMMNKSPAVMVCMGDWHYDDINSTTESNYHASYLNNYTTSPQSTFYRNVAWARVWDDHDFCGNGSNSTATGKTAAASVYRKFTPHYTLPDSTAVYHSFVVGRVRFVLMDLRSEQTTSIMISTTQMTWVKGQIDAAKDAGQIVVLGSSVPWISSETTSDNWGNTSFGTTQRTELATHIRSKGMGNSLFLISGDAHMLAYDNGTNNTYGTGGGTNFRVFHGAALGRTGSTKGGPYSGGTKANTSGLDSDGQYAYCTFTDNGTTMDVLWVGKYGSSDTTWTTSSFTLDVPVPDVDYTMPATTVAFTDTHVAAGLSVGHTLTADVRTYTLTGNTTNLLHGRALAANTSAYTLTGVNTTFTKAIKLTADTRSYTLTGVAANLRKIPSPPLTGLKIWVEGENADVTVNNDPVSTLTDRSGNGNDFTQAGALRPVLETNSLNGFPSIKFNGSTQYMQKDVTGFGEHTIIVLHSPITLDGFRCMVGARGTTGGPFDAVLFGTYSSSGSSYRRAIGDASGVAEAASAGTGVYTAGQWYISAARSTGTSTTDVAAWVNGIAQGTGTSGSAPIALDRFVIGAGHYNNSPVDFFNSKIAAILIYDRALTITEIRQVEDYLNIKYSAGIINNWPTLADLDGNSGAINSVAIDLDGDGHDEFVTASTTDSADPHLRIWKYNGSNLVLAKEILSSAQVDAKLDRFGTEFEFADIDGDGHLELITVDSSNAGGAGSLLMYKHDGSITGTWTETVLDTWSGSGTGNIVTHAEVTLGDLDGDGKIDIVVRDVSHGVWVFKNTSSGGTTSFATRKFVATNPREGLCLADVYGNGRLQIILNGVILDTPADLVSGTYTIRPVIGMEEWYPSSITSATIDDYACKVEYAEFGGGAEGIVITNAEKLLDDPSSSTKPLGVRIYMKPADPINDEWPETTLIGTNFSWHSLQFMQIDGKLSIISAISDVGTDTATGRITYWPGNGDGTFDAAIDVETGNHVYSLAAGEVAGKTTIVVPGSWASGSIRAFYYRPDTYALDRWVLGGRGTYALTGIASQVTSPDLVLQDFNDYTAATDLDTLSGWDVREGAFTTISGGRVRHSAGGLGVAAYSPAGFTTSANHRVEVTLGSGTVNSNAHGAAAAIQADGTCYHVYSDINTAFFGYGDGAGNGSDWLSYNHGLTDLTNKKVRLTVSGTGVNRRATAEFFDGSSWTTPSGWNDRDFGVGKRLDGGLGGIAGFGNTSEGSGGNTITALYIHNLDIGQVLTLTADSRSYTLTGNTTNLLKGWKLTADSSSLSLTGNVANFSIGRRLTDTDNGEFILTGNTTALTVQRNFRLTAETGAYVLTNNAANLAKQLKLAADVRTYALTGIDAALVANLGGDIIMAANVGAYALTGTATNLTRAYTLTADSRAFTETHIAANLLQGYALSADASSYTLTGVTTPITSARKLIATQQTYTLTGVNSNLVANTGGDIFMVAESQAYTLTGIATGLTRAYTLTANTRSYALTGNTTNLSIGRTLVATQRNYVDTHVAATLTSARKIVATQQTYVLTGNDAGLSASLGGDTFMGATSVAFALNGSTATFNRSINATSRSYTLAGVSTALALGRLMPAAARSYTLTANAAAFGRRLVAAQRTHTFTGIAATLTRGYTLVATTREYALVGSSPVLKSARKLIATSQTYDLAAPDIGLSASLGGDITMAATPRSYTLAASTANVFISKNPLIAATRAYTLVASTAGFNRSFVAAARTHTLTTNTATFGRSMAASSRGYVVNVGDATFDIGHTVVGTLRTLTTTGNVASFSIGRRMLTTVSSFTSTGVSNTMTRQLRIITLTRNLAIGFVNANLVRTKVVIIPAAVGTFAETRVSATLNSTRSLSATSRTVSFTGRSTFFTLDNGDTTEQDLVRQVSMFFGC